jgi:hypothetical protein
MNKTRYIFRGGFFLLLIALLVYLNGKTENNIKRITKFKYDTFKKIKSDSLDTEGKLDVMVTETSKFTEQIMEESPSVRKGFHYIMGVIVLWVIFELGFLVARKTNF